MGEREIMSFVAIDITAGQFTWRKTTFCAVCQLPIERVKRNAIASSNRVFPKKNLVSVGAIGQ
jgi:hypothetical protein